MAPIDDPVRDGRFWLFPDGTRLPVISGGATDDGDGGDPADGDGGAPAGGGGSGDDGDGDETGKPTKDELTAMRAALKKANKAAADTRRKLKEYEDRDKTDGEKLADALKRAEAAELKALRLDVGHRKGLTPAQAKRLVGTTEEELLADADELLAAFTAGDDDGGKGDTRPKPPSKPKERMRRGTGSDEDPEPATKDIVAKIPRV